MHFPAATALLFIFNLADAFLTLYWIRNGYATEGNLIMAKLLDIGDFTFLAVKIGIGILAALVLIKWGDFKLAKFGLGLALLLYTGLMGIHLVTGLAAFGYIAVETVDSFVEIPHAIYAAVTGGF